MQLSPAFVLGLIVGCANTPASPTSEATIRVTTDQGVRVIGPTFELDFAADNIHMPEHLFIGDTDVLGVEAPCQGESRVGVAVAPAVQISAGSTSAASSEITVLAAGPAMAKIRVTYGLDYTCPDAERLSGTSEFTIVPSGRIVREDIQIQPSNHTLSLTGDCGCHHATDQSSRDLMFSSFWTFDARGATQVQADGSGVANDVYGACTLYGPHALGVVWDRLLNANTRFSSPGHQALNSFDWPTIDGHQTLAPTPQSIRSTIQVWAKPPGQPIACATILAQLEGVPLTIGSTRLTGPDRDGIYRDPTVHNSAFDVTAPGQAVPPGFAISVDLGGASHAAITSPRGSDVAMVGQREAEHRFVIVFSDGLAAGEHIAIEPRS